MRGTPTNLPFGLSASLACTRSAFETVGGFDESFPAAGFEEVDFCARVLRAGFRFDLAPDAYITYSPRPTVRTAFRQSRTYALGQAALDRYEGNFTRAPSVKGVVALLTRDVFRWICRGALTHPGVLASDLIDRYLVLSARRRARSSLPVEAMQRYRNGDPTTADFAVDPDVPLVGGRAFRARLGEARWYASDGIESMSIQLVDQLLPVGGVFVDCGANVGVFTISAALKVVDGGRIVSYEPDPRTRALLQHNIERHGATGRVTVRPVAVGAGKDRLEFKQYQNDLVSGLADAPATSFPGAVTDRFFVDVVALSEDVDGRVDMIKIDVEGFEPAVIDGAKELLSRNPHVVILIELNPASLINAGWSVNDLIARFPEDLWTIRLVDERWRARPDPIPILTSAMLDELVDLPGWYANLLISPRVRSAEIAAAVQRVGRTPPV